MSTVTITVNVAGTPDAEDKQALTQLITLENNSRVARGLSALPMSTAAERRAGAESIYADRVRSLHAQLIEEARVAIDQNNTFKQLKTLYIEANDTKRAAALAALQ